MEIATQAFWRANLAEFLATLFFVFVNCSVTLTLTTAPSVTQIALCFGLSIAVLVQIFGPTSGANINPAVTIGLLLGRKISILRAVFYMVFQCGGGITGAAICYAVTPSLKRGSLGAVSLADGVSRYQGFAIEGILTMILVLTVFASTDENRDDKTFGPALAIGLSVTVCHLIGIPFTGCGINPARALAPAVIMSLWPNYHWIYWAGPIAGAVLAAGFYQLFFKIREEENKDILELNAVDFILENKGCRTDSKNNRATTAATTGV